MMASVASLRRLSAVIVAAWKREMRSKSLLACYVLAALVILGSYLGYDFVGGGRYGYQLISDLFLAAATYFGGIIAIFGCATCVRQEVESRQIQSILSKPLSRMTYVTGQLLGTLGATFVIIIGMALATALVFKATGAGVSQGLPVAPPSLAWAAVAACIKVTIVGSIALCLSLFLSSHVASLACIFIYTVGHLRAPLEFLSSQVESSQMESLLKLLRVVLPNFDKFNLQMNLHYGTPLSLLNLDLLRALPNDPGMRALHLLLSQVPDALGNAAYHLVLAASYLFWDVLRDETSLLGMWVYGILYTATFLGLGALIMRRHDI